MTSPSVHSLYAVGSKPARSPARSPLAISPTFAASISQRCPPPSTTCLRFHPRCPFGSGMRHPCLLALMRNAVTDAPTGIQRIALDRLTPTRSIAGCSATSGVVKLWPAGKAARRRRRARDRARCRLTDSLRRQTVAASLGCALSQHAGRLSSPQRRRAADHSGRPRRSRTDRGGDLRRTLDARRTHRRAADARASRRRLQRPGPAGARIMSPNRKPDSRRKISTPAPEGSRREDRRFRRLHAGAQLHLHALPRALASVSRKCPPQARPGADQERTTEARQETASRSRWRQALGSTRTGRSSK